MEIFVGDTGSREIEKFGNFIAKRGKNGKMSELLKSVSIFFRKIITIYLTGHASGQYMIFLNNDTIVKGNWIDELIDPLKDKRIGVVGGKLLYKNETIQHAGMEFNEKGTRFPYYAKATKRCSAK